MEVDASRGPSVHATYPQCAFTPYHPSSTLHYPPPSYAQPGTFMPSSDFDDRPHPAPHGANYYSVAPAARTHELKSRHTLPPYEPAAGSRFPLRAGTWPILQPTMSATRPTPPVLPSLPSIIPSSAMGRDARTSSPEQLRSPSSSPYQSHAVPRPTLAPLSSLPRGHGSSGSQSAVAGLPRLPPILQVEKQQVTTSATQAASASRRRNEAHFVCPVPGCGSTFTRRFNLRGHLRSHTAERPFLCEWPGCNKGFARQHDCKRHQALHTAKAQANVCHGCGKTFSRLDALNRHLRSDGAVECRETTESAAMAARLSPADDDWDARSTSTARSER